MDKWNSRNSYDWLAGAVVGLLTGFFIVAVVARCVL